MTSTDFAPESRPVDAFDSAVLRFAWLLSRTESLEKWGGSALPFWVCVELVEDVGIRKLQLDQDLTWPLKALPKWISCAVKRQSFEPEHAFRLSRSSSRIKKTQRAMAATVQDAMVPILCRDWLLQHRQPGQSEHPN